MSQLSYTQPHQYQHTQGRLKFASVLNNVANIMQTQAKTLSATTALKRSEGSVTARGDNLQVAGYLGASQVLHSNANHNTTITKPFHLTKTQ